MGDTGGDSLGLLLLCPLCPLYPYGLPPSNPSPFSIITVAEPDESVKGRNSCYLVFESEKLDVDITGPDVALELCLEA